MFLSGADAVGQRGQGAEELCLTPGYTASCNEALNWKAEVEHACPDGRESCALWEAWNLDPYWRVQVTPMDLDDALYPPTTYTMIGHECRFIENNDGVFAVDKSTLDSSCTAAAAGSGVVCSVGVVVFACDR